MPKTGYRKTVSCNGCGKPISFVRAGETAIPVEPEGLYFVPTADGEKFILPNGSVQYGVRASDGLRGYKKHDCSGYKGRGLTEKEISKRSYY